MEILFVAILGIILAPLAGALCTAGYALAAKAVMELWERRP